MRLPGLGPKTARRIWQELGITTVAGAEGGRGGAGSCAGTPASAPAPSRRSPRRSRSRRPPKGRIARCSGRRCRSCARSSHVLREHPASVEVSLAGSARRMRETVRDLDIIATATDPQALVDYFCSLPLGRRRRGARARRRRRSSRTTACASTCASCRPRATATCCSTSPARSTTTSRCARTRCGAASRSPSTRSRSSRPARSTASRPRRRSTRFLGYDWIPPELRENGGELAAARKRRAAGARRAGRPARRPAHAHDLVGRQGLARGHGRRRDRARGYAYYAICDHSQRLRGDLLQQQAEQIDALNELVAPFRILKGIEVNVRPDGTLDVSDEELATRDWVVASVHSRFDHDADRAGARCDGEPVRRLHRPSRPTARSASGRRRRSTSSA